MAVLRLELGGVAVLRPRDRGQDREDEGLHLPEPAAHCHVHLWLHAGLHPHLREMADEDLRAFIQKIGYIEAMPVVVDPGVLNPYEFIGAVINRRLPNPFMPDAPQRIATDTSQKLAIRFGETIKAYEARGLDKSNLILIRWCWQLRPLPEGHR